MTTTKTSTIYSKAMTLGPFLTLILLASSREEQAEPAQPVGSRSSASCRDFYMPGERAFRPTPVIAAPTPTTGPFLNLILNLKQSEQQASGN